MEWQKHYDDDNHDDDDDDDDDDDVEDDDGDHGDDGVEDDDGDHGDDGDDHEAETHTFPPTAPVPEACDKADDERKFSRTRRPPTAGVQALTGLHQSTTGQFQNSPNKSYSSLGNYFN